MRIVGICTENCQDDFVRYILKQSPNHAIFAPEGIIFLKQNNRIIKDFKTEPNGSGIRFESVGLFEYNKQYLVISFDKSYGTIISTMYFFKRKEGALLVEDRISLYTEMKKENSLRLSRQRIQEMFKAATGLMLFNTRGILWHLNSPKDALKMGKLLPSDEEIVNIDYRTQTLNSELAQNLGLPFEEPKVHDLEEIQKMPLFSSRDNGKLNDCLIWIYDGNIWIGGLDLTYCSSKDSIPSSEFKIGMSKIPIKIPTIDEIIDYYKANEPEEEKKFIYLKKDDKKPQ